ncbi:MAG TPA: hypothetical protein VGQ76_24480 [Thermoanaerobaculia bacterium]|jgi:hypothetical protein|nr:hypothetical protein [Thermoanaerobaculia bacterium]
MKFNPREWVTEIVTSTVTGFLAGAVGSLFVSDPPMLTATLAGGFGGLVVGLVSHPFRVLLDRRPPPENSNGK